MRRLALGRLALRRLVIASVVVAAFVLPAVAHAAGGYYVATPPTKGALYVDGQDNRYLLGGGWLYRADPGNVGLAQGFEHQSSFAGWSGVLVPNSFNAGNFSGASMRGSIGWYRRDFVLPQNAFPKYVPMADRRWVVRFDSVNYDATVWLNGHELGSHAGAYLPFEFYLKDLRAGANRLVVRVDSVRTATDFPAGPSGGWWNFGGIQRSVYLRAVARADIAHVIVRPMLPCPSCAARIDEQATVDNPTGQPQTVSLKSTYGPLKLDFGSHTISPGGTWTATASARFDHPHLWSITDPYLYRARFVLDDSKGHVLGGYTVLSGVRSITVVGGHLELNGRLLYLRGVDLHEQDLAQGAAIGETQLANEIRWVRELGADVIRSHYPLNEQTLESADRDGILIWSEVPVYQSSAADFSSASWRQSAVALVENNIETNLNHPSVMLWSIGNEFPTPATNGEASYIAAATAAAKQLDPTRPVGMAIDSWPTVPCQAAYAPLDVIGYNDYFGWFDAGGGQTDDQAALGPYLDFLRTCYPDKALMVTEYGFEQSRTGPADERGTIAFAENAMTYHLAVFASKSYLSGAIWFAMQDFAARPGWSGGDPVAHAPFVEKGVVDLNGNLKASFAVMSALYHAVTPIGPAPGQPVNQQLTTSEASALAGSPPPVFAAGL